MKGTVLERFMSKVNKTDSCWLWTGAICSGGYGNLQVNKKTVTASRLSYELFLGNIPEGLWVLHKCDVRRCVNPNHLFLGTVKDNAIDMTNKNRGNSIFKNKRNQTHCIKGHEFTENNTYYYESNNSKHRGCKKCITSRAIQKFKEKKRFVNNIIKEYCNHGHKFDLENTRIHRGKRKCLQCNRERSLKYYHQKKEMENGKTNL